MWTSLDSESQKKYSILCYMYHVNEQLLSNTVSSQQLTSTDTCQNNCDNKLADGIIIKKESYLADLLQTEPRLMSCNIL